MAETVKEILYSCARCNTGFVMGYRRLHKRLRQQKRELIYFEETNKTDWQDKRCSQCGTKEFRIHIVKHMAVTHESDSDT